MSDLNLHTKDSKLTNFADDTQIHICEENEESLRKVTKQDIVDVTHKLRDVFHNAVRNN